MKSLKTTVITSMVVILCMVSCPFCLSFDDDSDADSSSVVVIAATYKFNELDGVASAEAINNKVKDTVCLYENGVLKFTKTCDICFYATTLTCPLYFNGMTDQGIYVQDGVQVTLRWGKTDSLVAGSDRVSLIKADCSNFAIFGSGKLILGSVISDGTFCAKADAIQCKHNLLIKDVNLLITRTQTSQLFGCGIHVMGESLEFNRSTSTVMASVTGILMDGGVDSTLVIRVCNFAISGESQCFSCNSTYEIVRKEVEQSIYISKNADGSNKTGYDPSYHNLSNYKYIETSTEPVSEYLANNDWIVYLCLIIFAIVFVITIIYVLRQTRGFKGHIVNTGDPIECNNEDILRDKGDSYFNVSEGSEKRTSVLFESKVRNQTFELLVDNKPYGYITNAASFIEIPNGNHMITICRVNGKDNEIIYSNIESIKFNQRFVIEKTLTGYKVSVKL